MKKLLVLLIIVVIIACQIHMRGQFLEVDASATIFIRSDGAVVGTDKIARNGSLYTFTDHIYDEVVVEKSNITIDGKGYTLGGALEGNGFTLTNVSHVTIQNTTIQYFLHGIYLQSANKTTILTNSIADNNIDGIRVMASSGNLISGNEIANNTFYSIYLNSSSHNFIEGNQIMGGLHTSYGIWLTLSSGNTILGNAVADNLEHGIWLRASPGNNVSKNSIAGNNNGVFLSASADNNTLRENTLRNNERALRIQDSANNIASGNVIAENNYGTYFLECGNLTLRNNTMTGNTYSFSVFGVGLSDFVLNVDETNTIDGKPIYYLVNHHDFEVPQDAGYVALVNSTRMTVKDQALTHNYQGVLLVHTTHSQILLNSITDNGIGIQLLTSSNNTIVGNNVRNNNIYGIGVLASSDNRLSQNNFINNDMPVFMDTGSVNMWSQHYPTGGNYWDDHPVLDLYRGTYQNKTGSDGIVDFSYSINAENSDAYPLRGPINFLEAGTWDSTSYYVTVISNSTISDFAFNPDEAVKHFSFNVTGSDGTMGIGRVAFPELLLKGPYNVTINDAPITIATGTSNDTHIFLYFTYALSAKSVKVIGTEIIPEYSPSAVLPCIMVAILLTGLAYRRKLLD